MSNTKITASEAKSAATTKAPRPTWKPAGKVHAGEQPFTYPLKREFAEPDWQRLPGYKAVSKQDWETALWQRRHTVKNLKELKGVFGDLIPDSLMASVERDIKERATMSIPNGPATPRPAATRSMKPTCGPSKASPIATPQKSSQSFSPLARSIAD